MGAARTPANAPGADAYVPETRSLAVLRDSVQTCHGCELYRTATQAVFGEGSGSASIVMIGEQPGDEEDRQGKPFVGPAGRALDRALEQAGIERRDVYVTNAVKHFKFEERGPRRIHKKPNGAEVRACEPWLEAEIRLIRPSVIVCLGATAAHAIFGNKFRLTEERGKLHRHRWARFALATIHPSALLRIPDRETRHAETRRFAQDLTAVRKLMEDRS